MHVQVASLKERLAEKAARPSSVRLSSLGGASGGGGPSPQLHSPDGDDDGDGVTGDGDGDGDDEDGDGDDDDDGDNRAGATRGLTLTSREMFGSATPSLSAAERAAMASSLRVRLVPSAAEARLSSGKLGEALSLAALSRCASSMRASPPSPRGNPAGGAGAAVAVAAGAVAVASPAAIDEASEEGGAVEECGVAEEGEVSRMRRELAEMRRAQVEVAAGSEAMGELRREMAAVEARAAKLAEENRTLKTKAGGEMSADDDAVLLGTFVERLGAILSLRRMGKFDQTVFEAYNAAMVRPG